MGLLNPRNRRERDLSDDVLLAAGGLLAATLVVTAAKAYAYTAPPPTTVKTHMEGPDVTVISTGPTTEEIVMSATLLGPSDAPIQGATVDFSWQLQPPVGAQESVGSGMTDSSGVASSPPLVLSSGSSSYVLSSSFGGAMGYQSSGSAVSYTPPPPVTTSTGIVVPSYALPGSTQWNSVKSMAQANPGVQFLLIVNPNNGLGVDTGASTFIPAMDAFPSNVQFGAYVYTGAQTAPFRPLTGSYVEGSASSSLESNIQEYLNKGYPIKVVFMDEYASSTTAVEDELLDTYAPALASYCHSAGLKLMCNPGSPNVNPDAGVDYWMVYESAALPSSAQLTASGLPAGQQAFAANGVQSVTVSQIQALAPLVRYLWVASDASYNDVPSYFATVVAGV